MLTIDELKGKYPKIYDAVFKEGETAGFEVGKTTGIKEAETAGYDKGKVDGIKEGAETECKRIQEVEAQLLPGHESLIQDLKYDGKTSGGEAAVQILQAENIARKTVNDHLDADAPKKVNPAIPPETEGNIVEDDSPPLEEKAKKEWDADAGLRAEFLNDFDSYTAYLKADEDGRVHILKSKSEK